MNAGVSTIPSVYEDGVSSQLSEDREALGVLPFTGSSTTAELVSSSTHGVTSILVTVFPPAWLFLNFGFSDKMLLSALSRFRLNMGLRPMYWFCEDCWDLW